MESAIQPYPYPRTTEEHKQAIGNAEGDGPEYAHYVWNQISKARTDNISRWLLKTTYQNAKNIEAILARLESGSKADLPSALGDDGWWTTEQAAEYLKLKVKTVREGAVKGRIPGHKYPENSQRGVWRFKKRELDRFLTGRAKKVPQKALEAW